jgi:1,4-dihydroxy-2-naphthoate octaprenyltransferase
MIRAWILAIRPKTLTAAVVPILAATALVQFQNHRVDWMIVTLCLVAALLIQIATNFINDALDDEKGADTTERIGPKRGLQLGLLSRRAMWVGAGLCLLLALLAGVPLVMIGGWPILLVGLISLFMAYSYTGGPFPLAYLGLGDLFVIIFFGWVSVGGVVYLLSGEYSIEAFVLGTQLGLLATVLIALNNLRDIHQDRAANKRTLAVRYGVRFVRVEIVILLLWPFLLQAFWYSQALSWWLALLPFAFLPLAWSLVRKIWSEPPSPRYNTFLAQSALLHSGFGLALAVALFMGPRL